MHAVSSLRKEIVCALKSIKGNMEIEIKQNIFNVYSISDIEERDDIWGFIYITKNKVNGKYYLGQRIKRAGWKKYLGSGRAFVKALRKYKANSFERFIIDICETQEEANQKEYDLSKLLNVVEDRLFYNLVYGGKQLSGEDNPMYGKTGEQSPSYGRVWTDDFKKKMSENMKGAKNPNYKKKWSDKDYQRYYKRIQKGTPNDMFVYQYDLDGKFLKEFRSASIASKSTHTNHSTICNVCRKQRGRAGKYQWRYRKDVKDKSDIGKYIRETREYIKKKQYFPMTKEEQNKLVSEKLSIKIDQYDLNGNYINTYNSASELKNLFGYDNSHIGKVCKGREKSAYGYIWKYHV